MKGKATIPITQKQLTLLVRITELLRFKEGPDVYRSLNAADRKSMERLYEQLRISIREEATDD